MCMVHTGVAYLLSYLLEIRLIMGSVIIVVG